MKIEDVVEVMNSEMTKGKLVLHKTMQETSFVKAYKDIMYTLYYVYDKQKKAIIHIKRTERVLTDGEERVFNMMDKLFLESIFKYIQDPIWKSLKQYGID